MGAQKRRQFVLGCAAGAAIEAAPPQGIARPATLKGRNTYQAVLGPFAVEADAVEYYASAEGLAAPPGAPQSTWWLTLL